MSANQLNGMGMTGTGWTVASLWQTLPMAIDNTQVLFTPDDLHEVLDRMAALADRGDGKGWMNLQPWVEDADAPDNSPLGRMFSARGPAIPMSTWVPAHRRGRRSVQATLGLSHVTGRFAVGRLADKGVEVPPGWTLKQDHNRRGLVFEIAAGTSVEETLEFMLASSTVLSGVPITGRWVADVAIQR